MVFVKTILVVISFIYFFFIATYQMCIGIEKNVYLNFSDNLEFIDPLQYDIFPWLDIFKSTFAIFLVMIVYSLVGYNIFPKSFEGISALMTDIFSGGTVSVFEFLKNLINFIFLTFMLFIKEATWGKIVVFALLQVVYMNFILVLLKAEKIGHGNIIPKSLLKGIFLLVLVSFLYVIIIGTDVSITNIILNLIDMLSLESIIIPTILIVIPVQSVKLVGKVLKTQLNKMNFFN